MRYLITTLFLFTAILSFGQIGGNAGYRFLHLPSSARIHALGGSLPMMADGDVAQLTQNPALLTEKSHNTLHFSNDFFVAGIKHGFIGYGREWKATETSLGIGLQYVRYGTFDMTDIYSHKVGEFKAGEYAFTVGASRNYSPRVRYGVNFKFVYSQLERYFSSAIAADIGLSYRDSSGRFMAGLVLQNAGWELNHYTENDVTTRLPLDVKLGISKELQHVPFRFLIVVHNLQQGDIRYNNQDEAAPSNIFGEDSTTREKKYIVDKIARHFIFGGEIILSKSLRVRVGYNHLRRKELTLTDRRGLSGFSIGAGFRVNRFRIDYALVPYHFGATTHTFSLSTNLNEFMGSVKSAN